MSTTDSTEVRERNGKWEAKIRRGSFAATSGGHASEAEALAWVDMRDAEKIWEPPVYPNTEEPDA